MTTRKSRNVQSLNKTRIKILRRHLRQATLGRSVLQAALEEKYKSVYIGEFFTCLNNRVYEHGCSIRVLLRNITRGDFNNCPYKDLPVVVIEESTKTIHAN